MIALPPLERIQDCEHELRILIGGNMAQITTVLISYGRLQAIIEVSYKWYSSDFDTWTRTEGMHVVPSGGLWYQHKSSDRGCGSLSLDNGKGDSSMRLYDFDRKDEGRRGKGIFHGFDAKYNIPKYADINWEIVMFD